MPPIESPGISELVKRLIAKTLRKLTGSAGPTSVSDNDAYPALCLQASRDERVFAGFRSNPVYNAILEHVTEEQGRQYLEIVAADGKLLAAMSRFRSNDDFGGPRTFEYPGIGRISPSTLRYVKVLADLRARFGSLDRFHVCEIGVGYGGQCRIINAWFAPARYYLVDIAPALALARRFLERYPVPAVLEYRTMDELPSRNFDLVISNYAFTELPRPLQDAYLEKVILRSARGYITYNEISPREFRSYKAEELLRIIPGARTLQERPLTHPMNCIIIWGATGDHS